MKNFDAHAALVAAANEMRARRISDDRTLVALVNARRANAKRNAAQRANFALVVFGNALAAGVLFVAVAL